jgi:hypothetical protein
VGNAEVKDQAPAPSLVPQVRSNLHQTDAFRFKRAAFLQSLKSKIRLAASKAAALRINLNIQGCGIVGFVFIENATFEGLIVFGPMLYVWV